MVTSKIKWLLMLDVAQGCCLLAAVYLVHSKQYKQQFCSYALYHLYDIIMHQCFFWKQKDAGTGMHV